MPVDNCYSSAIKLNKTRSFKTDAQPEISLLSKIAKPSNLYASTQAKRILSEHWTMPLREFPWPDLFLTVQAVGSETHLSNIRAFQLWQSQRVMKLWPAPYASVRAKIPKSQIIQRNPSLMLNIRSCVTLKTAYSPRSATSSYRRYQSNDE